MRPIRHLAVDYPWIKALSEAKTAMRRGGTILIDQLRLQGVESVFLVPGESFLAALDAMADADLPRAIVCRHEGGAAMMAEATGKLTGRPGVVFVTRGPGAANAASGLHVAHQDQTPLVLLVGLPRLAHLDRSAFQDFDIRAAFGGMAKMIETVLDPLRIPDTVARAFMVAMSGRPGPVVLGFPEDILMASAECADAPRAEPPHTGIASNDLETIGRLIEEADWPLVITGGPGFTRQAQMDLQAFAVRFDLPVAAAFRAQDHFDNRHRCYAGHIGIKMDPKLASAIKSADLLIALGAPLDDIGTTGWSLVTAPSARQRVVQIHPGGVNPRDGVIPDLAIAAALPEACAALNRLEPPLTKRWSAFRRDLRAAYEATQDVKPVPGAVHLGQCVRHVSDTLPESAVLASGAGNFSQFVHRYFTYKRHGTSLAPASGSMGYGLPAAIAAKVQDPQRIVVAFAGDGCFMMTAQELATAVQYQLALIVIVADNGMYGTIRMHQEREFPGRVSATTLVNPDFAAMAESFGAHGATIVHQEEFAPAFREALARRGPSVLHLKLDPEAITPIMTLSDIRKASAK